jgi:hypothetical protein
MTALYTKQDLDAAVRELRKWESAFENYDGNNPDKYRSQISAALVKVRNITESLKRAGVIELTAQEKLDAALDKTFPNARHKQVVELERKRYKSLYFPAEKSRSGKSVKAWDHFWEPVKSDETSN